MLALSKRGFLLEYLKIIPTVRALHIYHTAKRWTKGKNISHESISQLKTSERNCSQQEKMKKLTYTEAFDGRYKLQVKIQHKERQLTVICMHRGFCLTKGVVCKYTCTENTANQNKSRTLLQVIKHKSMLLMHTLFLLVTILLIHAILQVSCGSLLTGF